MIDRATNASNWDNLSSQNYKVNTSGFVIKQTIENEISLNSFVRSGFRRDDYSYYFGVNKFTVKSNGNKVIILLNKLSNGKYPSESHSNKFAQILSIILKNEISQNRGQYTPHSLSFISGNNFTFGDSNILIKNYRDYNRTEKVQINSIKKMFKGIINNNFKESIEFQICNDTHTINFNDGGHIISSIDQVVYGINAKADCVITTQEGQIYISLKGETYRQFGGISEFMNSPEVSFFVKKLKDNQNKLNGKKCYKKITDTDLINKSLFGRDYGSPAKGPNNVNYVLIGNINTFGNTISASKNNIKNGQSVIKTFYIIATPDANRNDAGIPKTRIAIYDHLYLNADVNMDDIK